MLKKILTVVVLSGSLLSCANRGAVPAEYSQFILISNLLIQADYSDIYFQDGGPIRPLDVNEYEPFCSLNTELTSSARALIEIEADTFTISNIEKDSIQGESFTVSGGQKGGVRYSKKFSLASAKQTFVHSLVCQRWAVGTTKRYLTVSEIASVIGNTGKFIK